MRELNPGWTGEAKEIAPDGDAEVDDRLALAFNVPACTVCGGVLKPNVVFFGESVPKPRIEAAWHIFDEADILLVVGSSLAVYSGYRFVLRAAKENKPVAMINMGSSRGEKQAAVVVNEAAGTVLPAVANALLAG